MLILFLSLSSVTVIKGKKLVDDTKKEMLTPTFVVLYAIFALTWHIYISLSASFEDVVWLGSNILSNIVDMFNPNRSQPLYFLLKEVTSWQHHILRVLNVIMQIFVITGVTKEILNRRKGSKNFSEEYFAIAMGCLAIWFLSLALPYFSFKGSIDAKRLYFLTLIFLAPFGIIGGKEIFNQIYIFQKKLFYVACSEFKLVSVAALLILLLLFNTGFVDEVTRNEYPMPSPSAWTRYSDSNLMTKAGLSTQYTKEQDVFGAKWLSNYRESNITIYGDYISEQQVLRYGMILGVNILSNNTKPYEDSYIYLRYLNVVDNIIRTETFLFDKNDILPILKEKIYTNGGSEVYYYR